MGGNVGVGKTVAAAYAVAHYPARFYPDADRWLCLDRTPGLFRKAHDVAVMSQFDAEKWGKLCRAPMLAIDDLGTEPLDEKGWALSAILALIDRRYDDAARTVITSNLRPDAIRSRYGRDGGRFFDRLREAAIWVDLAGESLRRATP